MTKKYIVIAKVGNNPDGTAQAIRHHVNDLIRYTAFLDRAFPGWRWFNVYDSKKRVQIANYTTKDRPIAKWVKN